MGIFLENVHMASYVLPKDRSRTLNWTLLRPGLFDYLFQSLHRCGFRLQYKMKIQLFVMSHFCECGENRIHYIVENISAKKGGPVKPVTAEIHGLNEAAHQFNSQNNNPTWILWAQTVQPKQSRKCCLVYSVKDTKTFSVLIPHSLPAIPGLYVLKVMDLKLFCA